MAQWPGEPNKRPGQPHGLYLVLLVRTRAAPTRRGSGPGTEWESCRWKGPGAAIQPIPQARPVDPARALLPRQEQGDLPAARTLRPPCFQKESCRNAGLPPRRRFRPGFSQGAWPRGLQAFLPYEEGCWPLPCLLAAWAGQPLQSL